MYIYLKELTFNLISQLICKLINNSLLKIKIQKRSKISLNHWLERIYRWLCAHFWVIIPSWLRIGNLCVDSWIKSIDRRERTSKSIAPARTSARIHEVERREVHGGFFEIKDLAAAVNPRDGLSRTSNHFSKPSRFPRLVNAHLYRGFVQQITENVLIVRASLFVQSVRIIFFCRWLKSSYEQHDRIICIL